MATDFSRELMVKLNGKISNDDLKTVIAELQMMENGYDIRKKETSIVEYNPIIPECYKMYMISKSIQGLSRETLNTYRIYLEDFLLSISKSLLNITTNDIRVYLYKYQKNHNVCNRTLDGRRLVLNTFFDWLTKEGFIESNPCSLIGPIKFEEKPREPLTDIEMELIRDACITLRDKAMIETLYSTGCRVSELSNLNKDDVNFRNGEVHLFGKGLKHRISYINAKMEVSLKKYLASRTDNDQALFVTARKPHRRLKKEGIEKVVRDIGTRSGIGRPVFPHLLRHSISSSLLKKGMNVAELQKMLGHSKLDTTMIYAKVSDMSVAYNHKRLAN